MEIYHRETWIFLKDLKNFEFYNEFLSHIKPDEIWLVNDDIRYRKSKTETKCLACKKTVFIISKYHADYKQYHSEAIKLRTNLCPHCRVGASHMEIYQNWISLVDDDCWKDKDGSFGRY